MYVGAVWGSCTRAHMFWSKYILWNPHYTPRTYGYGIYKAKLYVTPIAPDNTLRGGIYEKTRKLLGGQYV